VVEAQIEVTPVVVGHFDRAEQAYALAQELGGETVMDDGTYGDWGNHARALLRGAQIGTSHVLCIEDDAVPVPNLLAEARKAVEAWPSGCISLYVGTGRPRQHGVSRAIACAERIDSNWLEADSLCWGVAFVVPTHDILPMLLWCKDRTEPTDQRIGAWYRSQRRTVRYTWPSLVDHLDGESLLPTRNLPTARRAWRVGTVKEYVGEPCTIARS
jgi:hypothetical protein